MLVSMRTILSSVHAVWSTSGEDLLVATVCFIKYIRYGSRIFRKVSILLGFIIIIQKDVTLVVLRVRAEFQMHLKCKVLQSLNFLRFRIELKKSLRGAENLLNGRWRKSTSHQLMPKHFQKSFWNARSRLQPLLAFCSLGCL